MIDIGSLNLKYLTPDFIKIFEGMRCEITSKKFKSLIIYVIPNLSLSPTYNVFCYVDGNAKKIKNYITATIGGEWYLYCARRFDCTEEEVVQVLTNIDDGIALLYGKKPNKEEKQGA